MFVYRAELTHDSSVNSVDIFARRNDKANLRNGTYIHMGEKQILY